MTEETKRRKFQPTISTLEKAVKIIGVSVVLSASAVFSNYLVNTRDIFGHSVALLEGLSYEQSQQESRARRALWGFKTRDANGDGVLNNDDFASYDLNGDGSVSQEEYLTVETQKRR